MTLPAEIIEKIVESASSRPHFHLIHAGQLGDPLPSKEEIKAALRATLQKDSAVFLERYGSQLTPAELLEFLPLSHIYEVGWYLRKYNISPLQASHTALPRDQAIRVRNRRYQFLKTPKGQEYMSNENMKERRPLLYHQYIGRFNNTKDKEESFTPTMPLSERLLKNVDVARENKRRKLEAQQERRQLEPASESKPERMTNEEEEELEERDELREEMERMRAALQYRRLYRPPTKAGLNGLSNMATANDDNDDNDSAETLTSDEDDKHAPSKKRQRAAAFDETEENADDEQEIDSDQYERQLVLLRQLMSEMFINGEDSEWFDYTAVDNNEEYDDYVQIARDAEDEYFDAEPPSEPSVEYNEM